MTLGTPENATEEDLESGKLSKKKMKKSRSCFQPCDYTSTDHSLTSEGTVPSTFYNVFAFQSCLNFGLPVSMLILSNNYVDIAQ